MGTWAEQSAGGSLLTCTCVAKPTSTQPLDAPTAVAECVCVGSRTCQILPLKETFLNSFQITLLLGSELVRINMKAISTKTKPDGGCAEDTELPLTPSAGDSPGCPPPQPRAAEPVRWPHRRTLACGIFTRPRRGRGPSHQEHAGTHALRGGTRCLHLEEVGSARTRFPGLGPDPSVSSTPLPRAESHPPTPHCRRKPIHGSQCRRCASESPVPRWAIHGLCVPQTSPPPPELTPWGSPPARLTPHLTPGVVPSWARANGHCAQHTWSHSAEHAPPPTATASGLCKAAAQAGPVGDPRDHTTRHACPGTRTTLAPVTF